MPWRIAHFESAPDGTAHVTALQWETGGSTNVKTRYQLPTAISIPPPGPDRNAAVARLKAAGEGLRNKPARPDMSAIEALLNAG